MRLIDRVGQRYGRLVVLERAPNIGNGDTNARWKCACDCGNQSIAYGQDLGRGKVKSCGCWNSDRQFKHGKSRDRIYNIWKQMFQRCENPKCKSFNNYGGRGITISDEWRSFATFYRDMGDCPSGYTIERIDNSLGYSKMNCRWKTYRENLNNKRDNVNLLFNGERHTVSEWARKVGIGRDTLYARLKYGWSAERALTEPIRKPPRKE